MIASDKTARQREKAGLGQLEAARIQIGEVLRINPQYSLATSEVPRFFKHLKDTEHLFDGLRKAGLPEC